LECTDTHCIFYLLFYLFIIYFIITSSVSLLEDLVADKLADFFRSVLDGVFCSTTEVFCGVTASTWSTAGELSLSSWSISVSRRMRFGGWTP